MKSFQRVFTRQFLKHLKQRLHEFQRKEQDISFFNENISFLIQQGFFGEKAWKDELLNYQEKVKQGLISPFEAADELYANFKGKV